MKNKSIGKLTRLRTRREEEQVLKCLFKDKNKNKSITKLTRLRTRTEEEQIQEKRYSKSKMKNKSIGKVTRIRTRPSGKVTLLIKQNILLGRFVI